MPRFDHRSVLGILSRMHLYELIYLQDHTRAFWARLGTLMPDYDRRKEDLRKLGRRLEW